ncbi:MAG: hypothetical protein ABJH69_10205 [Crocinitomicaceae bacterium]
MKAQSVTIEQVTNSNELSLLNSIRDIQRFNSQEPHPTAILLIESGYLSDQEIAGLEGMDVVLHKLYISIKQLINNERTAKQAYWIDGNFYNPRNYKYDSKTQRLTFQHGTDEQAKSTVITVTSTTVKIE